MSDAAEKDSSQAGPPSGVPYFDTAKSVAQVEAEEERQYHARFNTGFYTENLKRLRTRQRLSVLAVIVTFGLGLALWLWLAGPDDAKIISHDGTVQKPPVAVRPTP